MLVHQRVSNPEKAKHQSAIHLDLYVIPSGQSLAVIIIFGSDTVREALSYHSNGDSPFHLLWNLAVSENGPYWLYPKTAIGIAKVII